MEESHNGFVDYPKNKNKFIKKYLNFGLYKQHSRDNHYLVLLYVFKSLIFNLLIFLKTNFTIHFEHSNPRHIVCANKKNDKIILSYTLSKHNIPPPNKKKLTKCLMSSINL